MRFRFETAQGRVVEAADLDGLQRSVERGELTIDTPLFDALTGVTTPAGSHPAFHLVSSLAAAGRRASNGQEHEEHDELHIPGLEITLAEAEEIESKEELIGKLNAERERDLEASGPLSTVSLTAPDPAPSLGDPEAPEGEGAGEKGGVEPSAERSSDPPVPPASRQPEHRGRPERLDEPSWPSRPERPLERRPARLPFVVGLTAAIALGGGYFVMDVALGATEVSEGSERAARVGVAPGVVRTASTGQAGGADWVEGARAAALAHMVAGADSLARVYRVEEVPEVWLEPEYLAGVADHAPVHGYWVRYADFVRALRRQDEALFLRGFSERARELSLPASVVAMRVAAASQRFAERAAERAAVYDRMEGLAARAVDLHVFLLDHHDDVRRDPRSEYRAAEDPFFELVIADPELEAELVRRVDDLMETLAAFPGAGGATRADLTERVLAALRATGEPD